MKEEILSIEKREQHQQVRDALKQLFFFKGKEKQKEDIPSIYNHLRPISL